MTTERSNPTIIRGKVAAMAGNGFLSVRDGSPDTVCALTAVIPGKGGQRQVGAVIKFYTNTDKANADADAVNGGANAGWSDARIVPAVMAYGVGGKVDKAATKVALWLQAEKVHDWLAAQAAFCGQPLLTPAQQLNLRRDGMRIATEQAWNSSGIYVYSYGHYLTHPYHPESGRTLLKIGYADRATGGVRARVHEQGNTAIPEDPVLLRVYRPDDEIRSSELRLHRALESLGHFRQTGQFCGQEWFLTDVNAETPDLLADQWAWETIYNYHRLQER